MTYRIYAKCVAHYYVDFEADSEEDAFDKAEKEDADWVRDVEYDQLNDSWEMYDCEEV